MPVPPEPRPPSRRRRGLELLALSALALAQPVFEVVSRESGFFVAHSAGPRDLLSFAAIIYLAPPLILGLAIFLFLRATPRWGARVHAGIVALLVAILLLPPLNRFGTPGLVAVPAALLAGCLVALGLERRAALRSFLVILAPMTLFQNQFEIWIVHMPSSKQLPVQP